MSLPSDKLSERIRTIIEQPPFDPDHGGLASTERESFALSRATLALLAMQAFPVLARRFPSLRVVSLRESHPKDGVSDVSGEAAIRVTQLGAGEAGTVRVNLEVPTRSARSMKLLDIATIRKHLWRTLVIAADPLSREEAALRAGVESLEAEFAKMEANVPRTLEHLKWMGVLPHDFVEEYERTLGADSRARSPPRGAAGGGGGGGGGGTGGGAPITPALSLWWPPRPGCLNWKETLLQQQELAKALAELKVAEKAEMREKMAAAAEKRIADKAAGGAL